MTSFIHENIRMTPSAGSGTKRKERVAEKRVAVDFIEVNQTFAFSTEFKSIKSEGTEAL